MTRTTLSFASIVPSGVLEQDFLSSQRCSESFGPANGERGQHPSAETRTQGSAAAVLVANRTIETGREGPRVVAA